MGLRQHTEAIVRLIERQSQKRLQSFKDYYGHDTHLLRDQVVSFYVGYVAEESKALRVLCVGNTEVWLDPDEFEAFREWMF